MNQFSWLDHAKLLSQLLVHFRTLCFSPYWSRQKIEAFQVQQLRARLADAKNHVPFYQNRNLPEPCDIHSLSDWQRIPIVSKTELVSTAMVDRLNQRYLKSYQQGKLIEAKSSGSTGVSFTVYYDRPCFYYHMLAELRFFMMAFPYKPWDKQTYLYTNQHVYQSLFGMYRRKFISTLTPMKEIITELTNNPPDVLVSYPSSLRAVVDALSEQDLTRLKRIKAIGVNSEMSSKTDRKYLSDTFDAPVFDDYSSEELIWIASQCKHQHYHIFDDLNYIEVVDDQYNVVEDGVVGNIVGSNLHNRAMPFLRYLQGDRGAIRTRQCECGRHFKILEKLEGRRNDTFILPNGQYLSPGYLLDLTDSIIFKYNHVVHSFSLIQETLEKWVLKIVPSQQWQATLADDIIAAFHAVLKQPTLSIILEIVPHIPRAKSGKHLPIVSHVMRAHMQSAANDNSAMHNQLT